MTTFATADLYDIRGDELGSVELQFRNMGGGTRFSGPVRTVQCFEDNALLKGILSGSGGGAVLVVDGGGSLATALVGDVIAGIAVGNGWAGLVINGAVRDSSALSLLPLGIKALGTNPRKSGKKGCGRTGGHVAFGGVTFRPGAMLYADEDGILVEYANTADLEPAGDEALPNMQR